MKPYRSNKVLKIEEAQLKISLHSLINSALDADKK